MEDNRVIECMERADYILSNLMAVKPGEEVLIVTDPQTDMRMANAMAAAALKCGAEYGIYMMPIRGKDKATIFPKSLELGMDACDVFVGMTTASGAAIYNNHLKELINQKKLRGFGSNGSSFQGTFVGAAEQQRGGILSGRGL